MDSTFLRDEQNSNIGQFVVKSNKNIDSIWWMKGISEPDNLNVYLGENFDDQIIIEYPKLRFSTDEDGLVPSKTWTVELQCYFASFPGSTVNQQLLRFGGIKIEIEGLGTRRPIINGIIPTSSTGLVVNDWCKIVVSCTAFTASFNAPNDVFVTYFHECKSNPLVYYYQKSTAYISQPLLDTVIIGAPTNSVNMLIKYYVFSQNLPIAKNMVFFDNSMFRTSYFAFDTGIYDSDFLKMIFLPEQNRIDDGFNKIRRRHGLVGTGECFGYYARTYTVRSIGGTWSTFCPFPNFNNPS